MVQGRNLSDSDLLAPFLILKIFHYRKNKINDFFYLGLDSELSLFFLVVSAD